MVKKDEKVCKDCAHKDVTIAGLTKKVTDLEFGKVCKKKLLTEEQIKNLEEKKKEKKEKREQEKKEVEKMKEENKKLKLELLNRFGVTV